MDEKRITEKMKERGFLTSCSIRDGKGILKSMEFCYEADEAENEKRFPVPSYICTIDDQERFEFSYIVPGFVNVLKMGKASNFWDDDHFDRLASKFEQQAAILKKYCSI